MGEGSCRPCPKDYGVTTRAELESFLAARGYREDLVPRDPQGDAVWFRTVPEDFIALMVVIHDIEGDDLMEPYRAVEMEVFRGAPEGPYMVRRVGLTYEAFCRHLDETETKLLGAIRLLTAQAVP